MNKSLDDIIVFEMRADPNPLGVEMPEVLDVLLEQDDHLKGLFEVLTLGKKRGIIHTINRIKDLDKQVETVIKMLTEPPMRRKMS